MPGPPTPNLPRHTNPEVSHAFRRYRTRISEDRPDGRDLLPAGQVARPQDGHPGPHRDGRRALMLATAPPANRAERRAAERELRRNHHLLLDACQDRGELVEAIIE